MVDLWASRDDPLYSGDSIQVCIWHIFEIEDPFIFFWLKNIFPESESSDNMELNKELDLLGSRSSRRSETPQLFRQVPAIMPL